jgi:hypothetical protein
VPSAKVQAAVVDCPRSTPPSSSGSERNNKRKKGKKKISPSLPEARPSTPKDSLPQPAKALDYDTIGREEWRSKIRGDQVDTPDLSSWERFTINVSLKEVLVMWRVSHFVNAGPSYDTSDLPKALLLTERGLS